DHPAHDNTWWSRDPFGQVTTTESYSPISPDKCSYIMADNYTYVMVSSAVTIMIPSAPLSSRALALISLLDFFPTRVTLSVIDGDHLFLIVSPGTGSESSIS